MTNLSKEIENKAHPFEKVQNAGQAVEKFSHHLGSEIGSALSDASKKADRYARTTRDYIEEHPLQSVAIATAAGMAVGGLLAAISRRRH